MELDIIGMEVTTNNNLILVFNKPAYVISLLSDEDFEIRISRFDGTPVTNFDSDFNVVREMPSTKFFINLNIKDFLKGDNMRSRVEVFYRRSTSVFDERMRELRPYAHAVGHLNKQVPYMPVFENSILRALAIASNFSLVFGLIFTLILAGK